MSCQTIYPFVAIVGQEQMKLSLYLNLINPTLSGVLIRGEKGTAKSTAVRALADILEHAIRKGEKRIEPGLLAAAHRGILYVDEVNLLDDHVVDVLLDAAAMGISTIEREGISFSHPSRFVLVGTMNPEEGELRPQLLDRFGLSVRVQGIADRESRVTVMERRVAFDEFPEDFAAQWQAPSLELVERIEAARSLYPKVTIKRDELFNIADFCLKVGVDGHRGDIIMMKAAKTLAAFDGRREVVKADVDTAAELALPHRMRRQPLMEIGDNMKKLKEMRP